MVVVSLIPNLPVNDNCWINGVVFESIKAINDISI
jgi:hypothetical protein